MKEVKLRELKSIIGKEYYTLKEYLQAKPNDIVTLDKIKFAGRDSISINLKKFTYITNQEYINIILDKFFNKNGGENEKDTEI